VESGALSVQVSLLLAGVLSYFYLPGGSDLLVGGLRSVIASS